jgi:hypothetical protein
MTLNLNAQPGDETRRNGDYVGLDHPVTEERPAGGPTPAAGELVVLNQGDGSTGEIAQAPADLDEANVAGVLYTYQHFGETEEGLQDKIRTERDATVKTHGAVVADLGRHVGSQTGASVNPGEALGANGEILILEELENGQDLYEVLVR